MKKAFALFLLRRVAHWVFVLGFLAGVIALLAYGHWWVLPCIAGVLLVAVFLSSAWDDFNAGLEP